MQDLVQMSEAHLIYEMGPHSNDWDSDAITENWKGQHLASSSRVVLGLLVIN